MVALLVAAAMGLAAGIAATRVPRGPARRFAIAATAAGAAAGAVGASGAATGASVVDAGMRAALAAGCCLLASRTPQPWLLAAGLAGLAGAVMSAPGHLPATVLAGGGAGMTLARSGNEPPQRRTSLPGALAAGLLANAALRLGRPHPLGLSAAVAALIVVPILLGGTLRLARRRYRRRRIYRVVGVAAILTVGAGGMALLMTVLARPHLEDGIAAVRAGLAAARNNQPSAAAGDLRAAAAAFGRGNRYLRLTAPGLGLPIVAQQLRALRAMGSSGERLAAAGATTLTSVDTSGLRVTDGTLPLDRIAKLDSPLEAALATLAQTEAQLTGARSTWLVDPVRTRLHTFTADVDKARNGSSVALDAVRIVPAIAGGQGRHRYFLAVQTPAELRGTGGIIGNFGEIEAVSGRLRLVRRGRSDDLNQAIASSGRQLQAPADYQARYGRFAPQFEWRNVTLSPDFPTVAGVIETLYPQSGGDAVDGVISVDPIGLAALLNVVGPVTVPVAGGPAVTLSPDQAAGELLHDQYQQFPNPGRIDFLDLAIQAVWNRLTTGALPAVPDMLRLLGPALRGKHIMLAGTNADEERFFHRVGIDGAVAPITGDYLGLITQNASGNKIDWYLHRSMSYTVDIDPRDQLVKARVDIRLINQAPTTGEPPIVINGVGSAGTTPGQNRLYLSVYTPWQLTGATIDKRPLLMESAVELDRDVFSAFVTVPSSGTTDIELSLIGRYPASAPYRLDILHQPTIWPDRVSVATTGSWPRPAVNMSFDNVSDVTLTRQSGP